MNTNKFVRWLSLLIMSNVFALASQTAAAASDYAILTLGDECPFWGYANGWMGSYTPTGLTGGKTVESIVEFYDTCYGTQVVDNASIVVTGFSSNPGSSWLNSVTCYGISLGPKAGYYSYSGGSASWTLNGIFGLYALGPYGTTSCTVNHN